MDAELQELIRPRLVLMRTERVSLAPLGSERPVRGGRCGLFVLLTDGTSREITYAAAAGRDQALAWVLSSARRSEGAVAAVCDWSAGELAAQERRWRREAAIQARGTAQLERLLSGG